MENVDSLNRHPTVKPSPNRLRSV